MRAMPRNRRRKEQPAKPPKHTDPTKTPTSEAIERVMRIYSAEGYRKRTMHDYRRYIADLTEHAGLTYIDDLTTDHIHTYVSDLLERMSATTVNIRLSSIRAVINKMCGAGIIDHNPVKEVHKVKEDDKLPKILSKGQVQRFFAAIDVSTWIGFRDYCMCGLAYRSGLRGDEIERIDIADIDFDNDVILLPGAKNKNRKVRPVPLSRKIKPDLLQLVAETRGFFGDEVKRLFVTQFGQPVGKGLFRSRMYRYAEMAGITKETQCSPHVLRHTFAVNFLSSPYGNVRALQLILGHSHLSTTEIYLDFLNDTVIDQYHKVETSEYFDV
ncbi:MAG TPA: tyrosine-type recombinase/integrase [Bacillales bacterium]|nr:tyrosine-type recombinase/integrase [Bacillales bacterium]